MEWHGKLHGKCETFTGSLEEDIKKTLKELSYRLAKKLNN